MGNLRYLVGLDLGQQHDFTALAVLERREIIGPQDPVYFARRKFVELHLRHVERIPLRTPFPEQAGRVATLMRSPDLAGCAELIPDGTGVGAPVVDMFRAARLPCRFSPVKITGGSRTSESDGYFHVPKRNLILGLQITLQSGMLRIGRQLPFRDTLFKEMTEMRVDISEAGNERFGCWRRGQHDDLVPAVALSCWAARLRFPRDLDPRPQFFDRFIR